MDWVFSDRDMNEIDMDIVRNTYTKIFNNVTNIISIGPVARNGNKMQNSINYFIEGKIWAAFVAFSFMYPNTFQANGHLNFTINRATSGYVHVVEILEKIIFVKKNKNAIISKIKTRCLM